MLGSLETGIFRTSGRGLRRFPVEPRGSSFFSANCVLSLVSGQQCPLGVSRGLSHSLLEQEGASSRANLRAQYSRHCSDPS